MNLALQSVFAHTSKQYLRAIKSYDMGANSFTSPLKEGMLWIFIALKNQSPMVTSEPMDLGSNGKHITTKDDANHPYQKTNPGQFVRVVAHVSVIFPLKPITLISVPFFYRAWFPSYSTCPYWDINPEQFFGVVASVSVISLRNKQLWSW
jgi:hypothetical protein